MHSEIASILLIACLLAGTRSQKINPKDVRCHVCKATVHEMEDAVAKVDPRRTADVNGFRLDAAGNTVSKTVKLARSEMFLTELMESVCNKMEDYAKATHKKNGKFALVKMVGAGGQMNPEISNYDFIQDGDLNKSLQHYCLEILDDHEEAFLKAFMTDTLREDNDIRICSENGIYCNDAPVQEDYNLEDDEEFKDEL